MMQAIECKTSSNISWARFYPERNAIQIDFRNSKGEHQSTYEYSNFTEGDWEAFKCAESKGSYFAYRIRNNFPAKKLDRMKAEGA